MTSLNIMNEEIHYKGWRMLGCECYSVTLFSVTVFIV
jgi:hypothetical protein